MATLTTEKTKQRVGRREVEEDKLCIIKKKRHRHQKKNNKAGRGSSKWQTL